MPATSEDVVALQRHASNFYADLAGQRVPQITTRSWFATIKAFVSNPVNFWREYKREKAERQQQAHQQQSNLKKLIVVRQQEKLIEQVAMPEMTSKESKALIGNTLTFIGKALNAKPGSSIQGEQKFIQHMDKLLQHNLDFAMELLDEFLAKAQQGEWLHSLAVKSA